MPDFQLRNAEYAFEPTEGKLVKPAEAVAVLVPARLIEAGLAGSTRPPAVLGDGNWDMGLALPPYPGRGPKPPPGLPRLRHLLSTSRPLDPLESLTGHRT